MSKKFILITLCLLVIFASFSAYAFQEEKEYARLIDYCIVKGDENGNLNLDSPVTRAEMTQIIVNVLKMDSIKLPVGMNKGFTDVFADHWGYNAIMNCKELGIVSGNGDGTFLPDNQVTFAQAVKMLVTTLGYDPLAQARGGWQNGYLTVAANVGLTKGFNSMPDDTVLRKDVFRMMENALDIPIMVQTGFGSNVEYSILDGKNGTELRTLESEFK